MMSLKIFSTRGPSLSNRLATKRDARLRRVGLLSKGKATFFSEGDDVQIKCLRCENTLKISDHKMNGSVCQHRDIRIVVRKGAKFQL